MRTIPVDSFLQNASIKRTVQPVGHTVPIIMNYEFLIMNQTIP